MKKALSTGFQFKDTVTTDKENDKVDGHKNALRIDTSICINAVVHDLIPILPGQYLCMRNNYKNIIIIINKNLIFENNIYPRPS